VGRRRRRDDRRLRRNVGALRLMKALNLRPRRTVRVVRG
jgi:hypothetical protein